MKYKDNKRISKNGYVVILDEDDVDSFDTGTGKKGVYEHRLIAREIMGRNLYEDEVVHHLDGNKINNSPDNLLVLSNSQHTKLHQWLDKNIVIPKPSLLARNIKGCIRCPNCEKPIKHSQKFCSSACVMDYNNEANARKRGIMKPTKEQLKEDLSSKINWCALGRKYNVSDNAVRKWAKRYELI